LVLLATGYGFGTILFSSDIACFVQGGVVKTFRWWFSKEQTTGAIPS